MDLVTSARRKKVKNIAVFHEAIQENSGPSLSESSPKPTAQLLESSEGTIDDIEDNTIALEHPPTEIKHLVDEIFYGKSGGSSVDLVPEAYHYYFRWRREWQIGPDESWWSRYPITIDSRKSIIPPPLPPFSEEPKSTGNPDGLVRLMVTFENSIRKLSRDRKAIGTLMVFVLDHEQHAEELMDSIARSTMSEQATFEQIVARLYLLSDILHNVSSSCKEHARIRRAYNDAVPLVLIL